MKKEEQTAFEALQIQIPMMPHGQTISSTHVWSHKSHHKITIRHGNDYAINHGEFHLEITEIHNNITTEQALAIINSTAIQAQSSTKIEAQTTENLKILYNNTRKELKQRRKIAKEAKKICTNGELHKLADPVIIRTGEKNASIDI